VLAIDIGLYQNFRNARRQSVHFEFNIIVSQRLSDISILSH